MRHLSRALSALLAAAFVASVALANLGAPTGGWVGYDAVPDRETSLHVDGYGPAIRALGCTVGGSATAGLSDRAVVREDGTVTRMTFGELARVSKVSRVWVVGACGNEPPYVSGRVAAIVAAPYEWRDGSGVAHIEG